MNESVIFVPPFQTPVKPKYGTACNGCGWCCHTEVCKVGMHFFDIGMGDAPCPAILYEEGRVKCGLVIAEREALKTDTIATALGVDKGCDASDPGDYE